MSNIHQHAETLQTYQFKGDKQLVSITLGNSIQNIPQECFRDCRNLKKFIIPRSVKSIDSEAFANSGLEEILFEEGCEIETIADGAFSRCLLLQVVKLPSTVRIIGDDAFFHTAINNTSISDIFVNGNIEHIGANAFSQCTNFQLLTIPSSLKTIGKHAFSSSSIETIEFSSKSQLESISEYMFSNCKRLSRFITFPSSIKSIDLGAFHDSEINETMFHAIFSNGTVTHIGDLAFSNCPNLSFITIHSSVKSIGKFAFQYSDICKVIFSKDSQLEVIPNHMLFNCIKLEYITLPLSIISIGESAFAFSGISVQSVKEIFKNCTNIRQIDNRAFAECPNLKRIEIPSSVTSRGVDIFAPSKATWFSGCICY